MIKFNQLIRHSGSEPLFHAIEMSIIAQCNNQPFHIHTEGLRGTGKTTVLRAARSILPPITRIKGCIYNCDPAEPHCPLHCNLSKLEIKNIGIEIVPRPFLEISHSARTGSVVGSIDLGKLTDKTNFSAALLPGTIPQAHRGVLFIDEINRLADTSPELADILLDVMGTKPGRIQIEEPGLPTVEMPLSVSVWAASNPDEDPGPLKQLRRQLADRFDLLIPVSQPTDPQAVYDILKNRHSHLKIRTPQPLFTTKMDQITVPDAIRQILANIYVIFKLESLRAIEAVETAAGLEALLSGNTTVNLDHVARIIPFALGHRTDANTIADILAYIEKLENQTSYPPHNVPVVCSTIEKSKHKFLSGTWWKKWLRNPLTNHATGQQSADNQEQTSIPSGNPLTTKLTAPPQPALPLSQLSDDKLVTIAPNQPPHDY